MDNETGTRASDLKEWNLSEIFTFKDGWRDKLSTTFNSAPFSHETVLQFMKNPDAVRNGMEVASIWLNILLWQREHRMFDLRNKKSVNTAEMISHTVEGKKLIEKSSDIPDFLGYHHTFRDIRKAGYGDEAELAILMMGDHRTIQQNFSRFIFGLLKETTKLDSVLPEYWDSLPFI